MKPRFTVFHLVLLSIVSVTPEQTVYQRGQFPYSKCIQASDGVSCETLSIKKGIQDKASLWPPGTYALRMAENGCPEGHIQGWRRGVFNIRNPNISGIDWKIHFCVKERAHPELDKERWISGNYTIFKKGDKCPEEFTETEDTWNYGTGVVEYDVFGFVPEFTITNDTGNSRITFYMCEHISMAEVDESDSGMWQTNFLLGMKEGTSCEQFKTGSASEFSVVYQTDSNYMYCLHAYRPYEELNGVNVAVGKPAEMSSMFGLKAFADNAVDGNLDSMHEPDQLCFHTLRTTYNWWYVDLQGLYQIERVKLYNRGDGFDYRAREIEILVGNTLENLFKVGFVESMGATLDIYMPNNTVGRYVKLYQIVEEYLHFCEIEVYSFKFFKIGTFAELTSGFLISRGTLPSTVTKNNGSWYQLDLRRNLLVFEIELQTEKQDRNAQEESSQMVFTREMYVACLYDDVPLSFLRQEAKECRETLYFHSGTVRLYLPNVRARYITLVVDEPSETSSIMAQQNVRVFLSDLPENGLCNEDLGMSDGSIQDFQISASTWLPGNLSTSARPSSNAWCPQSSDTKPWILVDLIAITAVEGISVWRRESPDYQPDGFVDNSGSFHFYYGTDVGTLIMYNDTEFAIKTSHSADDIQIFTLLNPIQTRYVKLEFKEANSCLRFELQGCKLSGLPTLNCPNPSKMFDTGTSITTEGRSVIQNNVDMSENCSTLCSHDPSCSVATFEGVCIHYSQSEFAMWRIGEPATGEWSTKLCATDPVELFPTLLHTEGEISTNIETVSQNAVITSIGYPFSYETGKEYKWLIQLSFGRNIRLVFTNVSLSKTNEGCSDTIFISKEINMGANGKVIDHNYNDRVFVVETSETSLTLTFKSCLTRDRNAHRGFRTLVTGEATPACLSIDSDVAWSRGRRDICSEPEMFLTSMSLLNLPFADVEETWEIRAGQHQTVQLRILDFYVVCPLTSEENQTRFAIIDAFEENVFCNTDLPPEVIIAQTSDIVVKFRKHMEESRSFIRTEGFRLRYTIVDYSLEHLKDVFNATIKVCSSTFKKCYRILPSLKTWTDAAESCLQCNQTLVSVQSRYEMDFINYLLRDLRYMEDSVGKEGLDYDSSFMAHIGLRRYTNRLGKKAYIWENTSPVTYAAWRSGNPSGRKECTRTNFELFANRTWESEHCTTDVAQFYVCQSPMEEKSDDDGEKELCTCPRGWIQNENSCYYFSSKDEPKRNWTDASKACKELDSYLLEVDDAAENKFMESVIMEKADSYWMGASDLVFEGIFLWNHSGKAVVYTDWLFGEPNNWNGNEDCVRYWWKDTYRKWNDAFCSNPFSYICEKSATTIEQRCEDHFHGQNNRYIQTTYSGNDCQYWNSLSAASRDDFRVRFPNYTIPTDDSNNCRDPSLSGILWCYTKSSQIHLWEPCFLTNSEVDTAENTTISIFECNDGSDIPGNSRCDGVFDCGDFSDEIFCRNTGQYLTRTSDNYLTEQASERLEKAPYFQCGSQEWISVLATCDVVIDCLDASDEMNCTKRKVTGECASNVTSDSCTEDDDICVFTPDSANAAEDFRESRPCDSGQFSCDNGRCVSDDKRCNAIADCNDGSDEKRCDSCKDAFHCDNGRCIPMRLVCDVYPDCEDGSDEISCFPESLGSCDQWWERGYHDSGEVMIDGVKMICDFSSMESTSGTISMSILNMDVEINEGQGRIYTREFLDSFDQYQQKDVTTMIYRDGYECFLEVQTACKLHTAASQIKPSNTDNLGHECQCKVDVFKTSKQSNWVWRKLDENENKFIGSKSTHCINSHDEVPSGSNNYNVTGEGYFTLHELASRESWPAEITPGPVTCIYEYTSIETRDLIGCEGEDQMIRSSLMCLYDVDPSGFLIGCRSGSHLQNCGNFVCPDNTVKCPGSYCIPLNFVCDQKIDCPDGHDEYQCACKESKREILILLEDSANQTESTNAARKLADQFYSTGSKIRVLYYKTFVPLEYYNIEHRLLEIREESIQSEIKKSECRFKILARAFLKNVRFETGATKSVVFIQDSLESSKVAHLMFSNMSIVNFTIFRVVKDAGFSLKQVQRDEYSFVKDVHINRWEALYSVGYSRFPEICEAVTEVPCSGGYKCSSSKQCIPLDQVCDGITQCNDKDDEWLCDFFCPDNCACVGYSVDCHGVDLHFSDAVALSINTQSADLSQNLEMQDVLKNSTLRFPHMTRLNLSACAVETVTENGLFHLATLQCLDIGYNNIKILTQNTFSNLKNLVHLNLDGNFELKEIASTAFRGLKMIRHLRITNTNLKRISAYTFADLHLQSVDISYNQIEEIEDLAFNNTSVGTIDFRGNDILIFNKGIFDGIASLKELMTPAFKFCCIRPCYVNEDNCLPRKNEFSSCGDLMRHPVLQAVLWLIGIAALLGNFGSIVYRLVYDRARLKIGYGIFVTNLAAADFLMGVYLIMIAVVDSLYRNRYIYMDDQWRNSSWCVAAGVLSTVSSEASVLFLILITLDRVLVIKYPFGNIKFGPKRAHFFCLISWLIALFLSVFPLMHKSYFKDKFYSRSGVCIALPLTRDKPPGWMYSVGIFVGLNFCTFILVALGQVSIFLEIRKATITRTQKSRKRDLQVARNLILVATTDFMCWFPIGLMGIMALTGYPIPGDVYAWTAVFILPLNSALNPILYTLTAIIGKQSFNPSLEEQTRTEWLKETGLVIVQYNDIIRCVRTKGAIARTGKCVHDFQNYEESLSALDVLATGLQLSKFLTLLHDSSVCIDKITKYNTYLKFSKMNNKVDIVLDSKLITVENDEELQGNILQFGKLLRHIVALVDRKPKL